MISACSLFNLKINELLKSTGLRKMKRWVKMPGLQKSYQYIPSFYFFPLSFSCCDAQDLGIAHRCEYNMFHAIWWGWPIFGCETLGMSHIKLWWQHTQSWFFLRGYNLVVMLAGITPFSLGAQKCMALVIHKSTVAHTTYNWVTWII